MFHVHLSLDEDEYGGSFVIPLRSPVIANDETEIFICGCSTIAAPVGALDVERLIEDGWIRA